MAEGTVWSIAHVTDCSQEQGWSVCSLPAQGKTTDMGDDSLPPCAVTEPY